MAVYKEITLQELEERPTLPVSIQDRDKVRAVVTSFITHMKASLED